MRFSRVPITRVYVLHPLLIAIFKPLIYCYVSVLGKRTVHRKWLRKIITLYNGHRKMAEIISGKIVPLPPEEHCLSNEVHQNLIV
jgi:hypothetical protein